LPLSIHAATVNPSSSVEIWRELAGIAKGVFATVTRRKWISSVVSENAMAKSGFAKEHLRSFVERIERLEEEKKALADDIREVYSEAKGTGFDTKVMRQVVRLRKMESADRQEQEAMLDLYLNALGMRR
jgi:uncharacterized protein (UPF0335 family)